MASNPAQQLYMIKIRYILNSIHAIKNQHSGSALQPNPKLADNKKYQDQVSHLANTAKALRRALEANDDPTSAAKQMVAAMDALKSNALIALKTVLDNDNAGNLEFINSFYEPAKPETRTSELL